jgi:superfamily I DNA and/or RNA helicase
MLVELTWLDKRQKLVHFTDSTLTDLKAKINSEKKNLDAIENSISAHQKALTSSALNNSASAKLNTKLNTKSNTKSAKDTALSESLEKLLIRQKQTAQRLSDHHQRFISIDDDVKGLRKIVQNKEIKLQELADKAGVKEDDLSLVSVVKLKHDSLAKRARLFSMAQEYEQFAEHQMDAKLEQYKSDSATLKAYSTDARLLSANVIGMTLDSFIARTKDKPFTVDHVFIDEAGYASLVKTLPAFITRGPITLLGDHKQLPPVCELNRDNILSTAHNNAAFVWDLSAIHCESVWTAATPENAVDDYQQQRAPDFNMLSRSALTSSFRFGKKLASVLDQYVYVEEGFHSGLDADTKLSIFNVQNQRRFDQADIGRRANMSEALCVLKIIQQGIIETNDFAVLTPYRDQVSLLAKLKPELLDHDRLLTVHKSQGREWHTVIYSVCDIGNGASPWFTDSTNALSGGLSNVNTAVSRAKQHLIIVCDSNAWEVKKNQLISGLIQARSKRYQYQEN